MRSGTEFIVAALLLGLMIVFRVVNILTWKFETDESQHLHVIWGWARGFVQYRDLCDNHMPLFQLLFAPVYALIGDRPTILYWMRFITVPLYLVAAWCTYRIGSLVFSRRAGVWAVLLVGFYPGYSLASLEFRTDNLWAPLWLLAIVFLVKGPLTPRRALGAGLLMGCCFGVSMKTALLFLSLVVGALLAYVLVPAQRRARSPGQMPLCMGMFCLGAVSVPALIMAGFTLGGVWPQFRYWVFENNLLPGLKNHPAWWFYLFPLLFPVVFGATAYLTRRVANPTIAFRRAFIYLTFGFYILALWSYWPLVTRQDYLPFQPAAFLVYTAALLPLTDRMGAQARLHWGKIAIALPALAVAIEFLLCLALKPFWKNTARVETDLLRAVYHLTDPGDFVLDEKGETVFRQRAFAPIWEPLVVERIRRGMIADDAPQRCLATHTCVARRGKDMTATAKQFIDHNFLPVGNGLYAAGEYLTPAEGDASEIDFDLALPAEYDIISPGGAVEGTLDGSRYVGERRLLEPGRHTFVQTSRQSKLAVIWAQAVERHFTPFR